MDSVTTEKPTEKNVQLDSKTIADGIAALKALPDTQWPKEEEESNPLYGDESATIYLKCGPKKWQRAGSQGKHVILPHRLSYNRNVCLIAADQVVSQVGVTLKKLLADIGVKGKHKTIPRSQVETFISKNNNNALAALADNYDLILASRNFTQYFDKVLGNRGKTLSTVNLSQHKNPRELLELELAKSALWENATDGVYMWKVAHTGHTDKQIRQNVQAALRCITQWSDWFPEGLRHFQSLQLKTGSSKGVTIYVNRGEVLEELPRPRIKFQCVQKKPAAKEAPISNRKRKLAEHVAAVEERRKKRKPAKVREEKQGEREPARRLNVMANGRWEWGRDMDVSAPPSLKKKKNKKWVLERHRAEAISGRTQGASAGKIKKAPKKEAPKAAYPYDTVDLFADTRKRKGRKRK